MKNKPYLTFRWHDLQYGIEAPLAQEIFPIPEITPIDDACVDIAGILNIRGQIVPIMHLDLLQRQSLNSCNLSDYVILLQWEGLQFGIVVHQVNEVLELDADTIEIDSFEGLASDIDTAFVAGIAQVNADKIVLIEAKALTSKLNAILTLIWDVQTQLDGIATASNSDVKRQLDQEEVQQEEELLTSNTAANFYDLYCPSATPKERAIFRSRADNLKQSVESITIADELIPLSVIGFGDEYFGLDLGLVREFTDISNLTPIPCCPKHIVGNMNLRGEIVTLVDIRNVLNLPTPSISVGSEAVVVQVDDIVAGLPVDRVLEMVYVNSADMTPLSGTLSDSSKQYFRGTALFQEKMLKVLDLPKIFIQGGLAVNEEA